MLGKVGAHNDVTHSGIHGQAASHPREDHHLGLKALQQHGGGRGGSHLADATQHSHHFVILQMALPERAATQFHPMLIRHQRQDLGQLFLKCADDGDFSTHELNSLCRETAVSLSDKKSPADAGLGQVRETMAAPGITSCPEARAAGSCLPVFSVILYGTRRFSAVYSP